MSEESSSFSQIVSDLRVFGDVVVVVASLPQSGQGRAQAVPALCHQLSIIKKLLRFAFNLYISLICNWFVLPRGIGVTRGCVEEGGRGGQQVVSWVHGVASWHSWSPLIPLEPSLPGVAKVVHAEPTAVAGVASWNGKCQENLFLCVLILFCVLNSRMETLIYVVLFLSLKILD